MEPQEISDDPKNDQPFVVFSHPAGRAVIAPNATIAPTGTGADTSWQFTAETAAITPSLISSVMRTSLGSFTLLLYAGWTRGW